MRLAQEAFKVRTFGGLLAVHFSSVLDKFSVLLWPEQEMIANLVENDCVKEHGKRKHRKKTVEKIKFSFCQTFLLNIEPSRSD